MRIACYALAEKDAGSVASANYLLVEELLRRGHTIDFYAIKGWVQPREFEVYPAYRYFGVRSARAERVWRLVPEPLREEIAALLSMSYAYRPDMVEIERVARAHHASQTYDVLLFLGVPAQFRVPGLPVVSWVQGPLQTEWAALRALRRQIIALCGAGLYAKLKVFYTFKSWQAWIEVPRSTITICGSRWARERCIAYGVAPDAVCTLPYPIDLKLFTPGPLRPPGRTMFLWLGRIDPRKRLDLLLDAFALLLRERSDLHLQVVGRIAYARGYRRLLETFPFLDHLTYVEQVKRADVPALIRGADVVVQPSESENFGSTVAEALCCGKPVVLGPTNGTADYVGEAGFLFEDYTAPALKATLAKAADVVRARADVLAAEARAQALREFSVARITGGLEAALIEAVRRHTARVTRACSASGTLRALNEPDGYEG
jgi:glycosyltransferase involved in cell wall biosynthesis